MFDFGKDAGEKRRYLPVLHVVEGVVRFWRDSLLRRWRRGRDSILTIVTLRFIVRACQITSFSERGKN
jgi:hypothetical protein